MKEWEIPVRFKGKDYKLRTVLEYHSIKLMRIRLYWDGGRSSVLFQNNFPLLRIANSEKGVQWKILEGSFGDGSIDSVSLQVDIFRQLEQHMKEDFQELYPGYL